MFCNNKLDSSHVFLYLSNLHVKTDHSEVTGTNEAGTDHMEETRHPGGHGSRTQAVSEVLFLYPYGEGAMSRSHNALSLTPR